MKRFLEKSYEGSYTIIKLGPHQTYKLNLPSSSEIHNIFHFCRLKPYLKLDSEQNEN